MTLAAVATGGEVIVSRGQLVEIGGSYRLPEVMTTSGAQLREVGTTNRTHLRDYEQAINDQTRALLRVHPSNFVIAGFTKEVSLAELVQLGRRSGLPVIDDVGSGAMVDLTEFGLQDEPLVPASIAAGADLVLFSGDKLLGGPQSGIIVGRRELIDRLTGHPLTRALRVDKMTLAALSATLRLYQSPDQARRHIPLLRLLSTSVENLANRAERLAPQLAACSVVASAEVLSDTTYLGGGSVPTQQIPTRAVALEPADRTVDELARQLRVATPSVFGRIRQDRLILDLRTVFPDQDTQIVQAVLSLAEDSPEPVAAPTDPAGGDQVPTVRQ